jgi:hypothetical protein
MITEVQLIFGYSIFIGFFLFMITLGAPSFLTAEAQQKLSSITVVKERPAWQDLPIIGAIGGFIKGVADSLVTLYMVMAFNSTIAAITSVIVTPYLIAMTYIIIKILRGGG